MNRLVIILVVALAVTMCSVPSEGKIEFLVLIQFNWCILKFRVFLCVCGVGIVLCLFSFLHYAIW